MLHNEVPPSFQALTLKLCTKLHKVFEVHRRNGNQSLGVEARVILDVIFADHTHVPSLALGSLGPADDLDRRSVQLGLGSEAIDLHEITGVNEVGHALVGGAIIEIQAIELQASRSR